ncbi:transporter [Brevundimonas sp. LM2]|uniref:ion channel n=1 Tax=Brevundimonas sp. LM2 TaxID=1938605 RepID=UPI000983FC8C|nr:ion channel [Brevundimonas sp. LM2]AQR60951.1 transporter [Brevundimonas sp. LM2]
MLAELAIATVMVLLTVMIHGAGLLALGHAMALRDRRSNEARASPLSSEGAIVAVVAALGLVVLHGVEIWLYAFLYRAIGAIAVLRDAVYFSTIAYGSIGFSDAVMAPEWKLLGAIEGINGSMLLGWSVAFFVTLMTRFIPARHHNG